MKDPNTGRVVGMRALRLEAGEMVPVVEVVAKEGVVLGQGDVAELPFNVLDLALSTVGAHVERCWDQQNPSRGLVHIVVKPLTEEEKAAVGLTGAADEPSGPGGVDQAQAPAQAAGSTAAPDAASGHDCPPVLLQAPSDVAQGPARPNAPPADAAAGSVGEAAPAQG